MAGASSPKSRARSIAHRWGAVCPLSPTEQAALGIRYDEEDDAAAETFVVKLSPGRCEIVDQIPGVATAVAAAPSGKIFVLDARGIVHVDGRKHKLSGARVLTCFGEGAALGAADRLWLLDGKGDVSPGPAIAPRKLASSRRALLAATDDGRLIWTDGEAEREVAVTSGGQMSCLALDDDGHVSAASGRTLLVGDTSQIAPIATAPFEIHGVALYKGRTLLSSKAHGLFHLDADEGNKIMPLKPSLRAHTLAVKGNLLVAASDLFVGTSDDGVEILMRDLAPFVRQAEQRLPKFHASDDPGL